jgi:branched-chain amino acid aminotransferase
LQHKDLTITQASPAQMKPKPPADAPLKFGHQYADHMAEIEWTLEGGWETPRISPMHNLSLHPGAKGLHYAIQLFEGMKAYRGVDNKIRLFRPEMNMERMRRTANRACLPVSEYSITQGGLRVQGALMHFSGRTPSATLFKK